MSKLEQNTTSLDEVLAMVNALPDAGSGGGGGASVETCNVYFEFESTPVAMSYMTYVNGAYVPVAEENPVIGTRENVVVNSLVSIMQRYDYYITADTTGAELLLTSTYTDTFLAFHITGPDGPPLDRVSIYLW